MRLQTLFGADSHRVLGRLLKNAKCLTPRTSYPIIIPITGKLLGNAALILTPTITWASYKNRWIFSIVILKVTVTSTIIKAPQFQFSPVLNQVSTLFPQVLKPQPYTRRLPQRLCLMPELSLFPWFLVFDPAHFWRACFLFNQVTCLLLTWFPSATRLFLSFK